MNKSLTDMVTSHCNYFHSYFKIRTLSLIFLFDDVPLSDYIEI